ncbi:MAG: glycoside hydrolase family 127 protein [Sedimentisphaerales bacterium]|jgi:DUF1680 family protein|nr:glycoside hydrolase family 127 protein [Sedimentisphaerales bacterium]
MAKVLLVCAAVVTVCLAGNSARSISKGTKNTSSSPYAKLASVDIDDVRWTEGFWAERFDLCHKVEIANMWQLLEDPKISGAYDNFLIAAGLKEGRHRGPKWYDGDFYKWLEAAAFVYGLTKDEKLDQLMDRIIDVVGKAQREDGYIHTPVIILQRSQTPGATGFKNKLDFETYNMGHLMTCACIHYRATGKTTLLLIAKKAADFLYTLYKKSPHDLANNAICPSHYIGVIDMYRTTGEPRYLELAKALIDIRDLVEDGTDQNQDRIPFRSQTKAVGHAVRANYLYAGAADVYAETGDRTLLAALDAIWHDVVYRKMYVTGATGALYDGASPDGSENHEAIQLVHQAYGREYQLPNITAYNESCATVGFVLWNWRMLQVTAQARFADVLELALYNGVLSAISLDGKKFFYTNPLRVVDNLPFELRWSRKRQAYISCFCCPPNVVRTIAEVSSFAYSISEEGVWVNLYGSNKLDTELYDGSRVKITQKTDYPWDGTIKIILEDAPKKEFSVFLRIPGWANGSSARVNGKLMGNNLRSGEYFHIKRTWSSGDIIELILPMPVQLIEANPLAEEIRNQVAIKRGPIVYCLESVDLPPFLSYEGRQEGVKITDVAIPPAIKFRSHWIRQAHHKFDKDLLGGVTILEGKAHVLAGSGWGEALYREISHQKPKDVDIRLIPYYAWGNRGKSEMTVWMPLR